MLEYPASLLLNLINTEGQHHQFSKRAGEKLLAVSVVVFELIALILEDVKRFILHTPPGLTGSRDVPDVVDRHLQTGCPGEYVLLAIGAILVFFSISQHSM